MFSNYPQRIYSWFLDLIFPVRCIGCGKFGNYICWGCLGTIAIKKNFECIGCKRNIPFGQTCFLCAKTNSVDQLLIVADYKNPLVEKSLKFLKYKFISDLERPLAILKCFGSCLVRMTGHPPPSIQKDRNFLKQNAHPISQAQRF